jgi:hypothetical protein
MHSGKDTTLHQDLAIGSYTFRRVDNFKYLGTMVNKMNNISVEVNARLIMTNRAYYGLQNRMKSRIISRNNKTLLYKTLTIPVLTHGCNLNKMNIVLGFLSPVIDRGGWRIRTNEELYLLYDGNDIVKLCNLSRMRWTGHVIRQDDDDLYRRDLFSEPGGKRPRGRPRLRWEAGVKKDVAKLRCRNWTVIALNREE